VVNDHTEEEGAMPLIRRIEETIASTTSPWEKSREEGRIGK